jgi:glutamyl-tRNA reductase
MRLFSRPKRKTFPINLIIDGKSSCVVGGGKVGARKVNLLLASGADVNLICPEALKELEDLSNEGKIKWVKREWQRGDALGHNMIFACTDDKHINRAILEDARKAGVSCCCSDGNWADGDFTTPAIAHLENITIAVSTNGQNCRSAKDLKNDIVDLLKSPKKTELIVLGTSDAILPSRKRAPYHLPSEKRAEIGRLLKHIKGINEFFILNTCNRIEIAAHICEGDKDAITILKKLIGFDKLNDDEYFLFKGYEAFHHLVRVASGLESSILGEFHIVSQMKDSFEEAAANDWSKAEIKSLSYEILRVSKEVRHSVEGLLNVAEIDQVALRYLSVHGGLDNQTNVVIIGTGMIGSGVVESLAKTGVGIAWIYHIRTPELPSENVTLRHISQISEVLSNADIVLSAVDTSQPVITKEMADKVINKNVLFVDLGVPRNIDPFYDEFGHGVSVVDLDDLKLWHRVKTGTFNEVSARADAIIKKEYSLS